MVFQEFFAGWEYFIKVKLPEKVKSKPKCRFPLLQLPRVVLLECIGNLDVLEIILFSLLSKRSKTIAKLICWNPIDIRLTSPKEQQICLKLSTDPGLEWIIHYRKKMKFIPIHSPWKYPYFQSNLLGPKALHILYLKDDGIEDITQMMEHICEVFRSPIVDMDIVEESIIEWIIKFQPIIRHVCIHKDVILSVESLDRILKNLEVTERFWLASIALDEYFQYKEPIPFRCIIINNSYWLTLTSILNANNSVIFLHDSKLTPTNINTILKEWQKGFKLRNLEYMEIDISTPLDRRRCKREIFKNLNLTVADENNGRPTRVKIYDENIYTLPRLPTVRNIIRSDGMILSIFGHYKVSEKLQTMKLSIFPYVVQNEILDNLKISELLLLSFVSKNMKKLIKSSQINTRFKNIKQIEYNNHGYPGVVHIPFTPMSDNILEFRERRDYETDDEFFQLNVSGNVMHFQLHYRYYFPQVYLSHPCDKDSAIVSFHYYFLDFFGDTVEYLYRENYKKFIPRLPQISLCLSFWSRQDYFRPENKLDRIRDIENFLASSPVLKRIDGMNLHSPERFSPESKFYQAESIILGLDANLVPDFLRHFQGRQTNIICDRWENLDLTEFMNRWKSGEGSRNLEYLNIRSRDIPRNEVLNSIGVKHIDESKTPPTHTLPKLLHSGFGPNTDPITSHSYVVRKTDNHLFQFGEGISILECGKRQKKSF
ncbi:hypothetical protein B9Z55_009169 [Caenorhabditis nigoni]|nr:hypothetical protein B9Z55_009169 [Caenorhabditis nigoni]